MENGADDYIRKPFNQTVLKAKIDIMARIRAITQTIQMQNIELLRVHNLINDEQKLADQIYVELVNKGVTASPILHAFHNPADLFNGDFVIAARSPWGG